MKTIIVQTKMYLLRRLERVFWPREEWFPMYTRGNYPRKNRAILRGIACVTNMAASGNLKMPGPCFVSDESVLHSTKMENLQLRNSQRRAYVAQSWPKRGEKGYLKSERKKVKSTVPYHEKRDG